jgi:c-di-GMP-binding flagellar brake protein YcgR
MMANGEQTGGVKRTERRAYRRYPVSINIEYRIISAEPNTRVYDGRTVNISSGGLLLESQTAVEVGAEVEACIALPGRLDNTLAIFLKIKGKSIRCHERHCAIVLDHLAFEIRTISESSSS